jgi:hypothetical protein
MRKKKLFICVFLEKGWGKKNKEIIIYKLFLGKRRKRKILFYFIEKKVRMNEIVYMRFFEKGEMFCFCCNHNVCFLIFFFEKEEKRKYFILFYF